MAEKPQQAWWLTLSVEPEHTQLDGKELSSFNASWQKAIYVDDTFIKQNVNISNYNEFKSSRFKSSVPLDLNNNKMPETIKVGVYKKKDGNKGIFLSIIEKDKILKVFTDSTNKGFSTLLLHNHSIRWYKCMNCGNYESIKWNGKAFTIE